jgi:hypothetical protein
MNDLNIYSSDPLLPNLQLARRSQQQNHNEPSTSLIEKIHQIILIWFIYLVNIFKLGYIVWFNVVCYLFSFIYQREKSIYNQIVLITGSGGYLGIQKKIFGKVYSNLSSFIKMFFLILFLNKRQTISCRIG